MEWFKEITSIPFRSGKDLFRVVIFFLLLIILITQFAWAERLIGRVLDFPELRHHITIGQTQNGEDSIHLELTVLNDGYGTAQNVLIHTSVSNGSIQDFKIDSQELYEIKQAKLETGQVDIWLDRLAPGSNVVIVMNVNEVWDNSVLLSATSDQGSSIAIDSPSFSGQVEDYTSSLTGLFSSAWDAVLQSNPVTDIRTYLSNVASIRYIYQIVTSSEFKAVALAALIVSLIIIIFLPDGYWFIILPLIIGFVTWLFFDYRIPTWWIISLLTVIALIILISNEVYEDFGLFPYGLTIAISGFFIWWFWYDTTAINWFIAPLITVLSLILMGYLYSIGSE